MPGSEVYQALQTKVIDAGLTDVSAAYSRKYYEVQEFGTVSPLFSVFFHVYVNPAWWEDLDQAARDAILEASAKAEQAALDITEQSANEAPGQLEEEGMKIHIHTPEEQAVFKDIMKPPFVEAFIEAGGDEGKKLIDMIESL